MNIAIFGIECKEKENLLHALRASFNDIEFYNSNLPYENQHTLDAVFYLDAPNQSLALFLDKDIESIQEQKLIEARSLYKLCLELEKELVIFDEDINMCIQFMSYFLELYKQDKYNPDDVAKHMLAEIPEEYFTRKNALVVDCDRTVSINDVSADFLHALDIDTDIIDKVFGKTRYTMYQFYKIFSNYMNLDENSLKLGQEKSFESAQIQDRVVDILENNQDALCIGITAGVFMAWQYIKDRKLPLHALFGNSYEKGYLVTPRVKKAIVQALQEKGMHVAAIGDSIIDIPMLKKADKGYLVAYTGIGKGVERYLNNNLGTRIKQLNFTNFPYENIDVVEFSI